MLACAVIEEGVELRRGGVRAPILVFGALSVSDLDGVFDHALTPTVSTPAAATKLQAAAARRGVVLECHLKIDTGMNRLGFRHDNLARSLPPVISSPNLKMTAVYSHAATADDLENPFLDEQRSAFDRSIAALGAMGLRGVRRHFANSAATLRDSRTWYDWVRPGLILYGVVPPSTHAGNLDLRPALSLSSRIVAVKGIRPGEGVGMAAPKPMGSQYHRGGPAGYADGPDTRLSNKVAPVGGRRVPMSGPCMDMLTVDVRPDVSPGDEVVFTGRQRGEEITAREMAATIGGIPWKSSAARQPNREKRVDEISKTVSPAPNAARSRRSGSAAARTAAAGTHLLRKNPRRPWRARSRRRAPRCRAARRSSMTR